MLGRTRRTSRLDVGLALAFTGIAYLVWALVSFTARKLIQDMIQATVSMGEKVPPITSGVKVVFVDAGVAIDLVGLAWLTLSLLLIVFAGRQKFSISWAWVSAICQSFVAAWGAVLVAWAGQLAGLGWLRLGRLVSMGPGAIRSRPIWDWVQYGTPTPCTLSK